MLKTDRVNRMSGLHFVKVKEYYEHITPEILHKYRSIIYANKIMRLKPLISCEPLLYDMMEEGGIDMSVFGVQSIEASDPITVSISGYSGSTLLIWIKT